MNHIMFKWDNSYDAYSANGISEAIGDRKDIIGTTEEDGYHFRSEGDLQPIMDVFTEYQMDFAVIELSHDVVLTAGRWAR